MSDQNTSSMVHDAEADWLDVLRRECARTSQAQVARTLRQADGYPSSAIINQVLHGKYASPTDRLAALVHGFFLGTTVPCPVLGAIRMDDCLDHQRRPYSSASPLRVQMYRACLACPHNHQESQR